MASLSGDARRALDICRRATEIAAANKATDIGDDTTALVGMTHVSKAHEEMFCSPRVLAIRCCSPLERILLRAVALCFRRSGIEETTFERAYDAATELLVQDNMGKKQGKGGKGAAALTSTEAYATVMELAANRLILAEPGKLGPSLRIWLNVSQDDVAFALTENQS